MNLPKIQQQQKRPIKYAAKCARAHFASKWSRPSHRPPQRRPTLLLRACTIYALGGEWREPAAEDKLCVPVPRQAHTRTRAYVCNLMRSPGEEILRRAGCRRERTIKRLQMEANIIAHAWLTPANFSLRRSKIALLLSLFFKTLPFHPWLSNCPVALIDLTLHYLPPQALQNRPVALFIL